MLLFRMPFPSPHCSPAMSMNCWYRLPISLFAFVFVQKCCWKNYFWSLAPKCPRPHPQCPPPAVFLYYKPGLQYTPRLPISCSSCNRKSLVAQDGDAFLEILEEPCPRREGSFEPGLKSGSCPEPREWRPPQAPSISGFRFPVSGGSALCHSAP